MFFNSPVIGILAGISTFFLCLIILTIIEKNKFKTDSKRDIEKVGLKESGNILKLLIVLAIVFIVLSFCSPLFFTSSDYFSGKEFKDNGEIGDAIGGLMNPFVAIAGVIVTGLAFYMQYQANQQILEQVKHQDQQYRVDKFESQFYKLLDYHKENVREMKFDMYDDHAEGRKVFKLIVSQIESLYSELESFFENKVIDDIINSDFKTELENFKLITKDVDLKNFAYLNLCYCIVFLGVSNRDTFPLLKMLFKKYKKTFIRDVWFLSRLKPQDKNMLTEWRLIQKISNKNDFYTRFKSWTSPLEDGQTNSNEEDDLNLAFINLYKSFKFYGGHQFRLSHYFRNLYQIYNLISSEKSLSEEQKMSYARIVRSQLSTYELYLLFYNSVSSLGWSWEFANIDDSSKCFITRYGILKNIPDLNVYNRINISSYFPNIDYDFK
ncbi:MULTISPECIES: putative phage abortive infection protein [unclassified Sphingobacterium]|uniref:putative phage abortive infection protein n=1 Tax=unclassified Sphingobacterium TaxID=2609468 RepID=UPI0010513981|nr:MULTISPECIES: putative phage abortive infection protein [unclassified Sphingobacterium]MCS3552335.1 hypothetical protein [Sphingobacterium sp. JUb21]TCR10900.1 putative phage abortive infection protein [Sphingobacterium sp. JUb20]